MPPIYYGSAPFALKRGSQALNLYCGSTLISGGAVLPDPTTVNFTAGQVSPGFTGSVSTTKNAARIYGTGGGTVWVGIIYGNEAKVTVGSDFGVSAGMIEVSVDGGAFSAASNVSALFTLFTGLPHAAHFVVWRFKSDQSTAPYVLSSGNIMTVTGQPPSVVPYANWGQVRDGNSLTVSSAVTGAASANYLPAYIVAQSSTTNGANVAAVKIRGAFNKLAVVSGGTNVYVSKDGAAPTKYNLVTDTNNQIRALEISGLGGSLATYYLWNAGRTEGSTRFSVSGDAALQDCGIKRKLDQYGDSITQGTAGGGTRGDTETMRVAAAIGFIGSQSGVDGHTIAQCDTLLTTLLANRSATVDDVAVIAIGRNGVFDAAGITAYQSIITKLFAAGYGKVLCRGVLPEGANLFPTSATAIQTAITNVGNANAIFIDVAAWSGIQTSDGTHPTPTGYATIAGYAAPAYTTALGL